jgi:hypothetical protein
LEIDEEQGVLFFSAVPLALFVSLGFVSLGFVSLRFASFLFVSLRFSSFLFSSLLFASLRFSSLRFASFLLAAFGCASFHLASLRSVSHALALSLFPSFSPRPLGGEGLGVRGSNPELRQNFFERREKTLAEFDHASSTVTQECVCDARMFFS